MNIVLTTISLYLLISVLLTAFFAIYSLLNRKTKFSLAFSLMCFMISIYVFGYVMELNSQDISGMLFWNNIQYLGLPFFPALWLIFSIKYTQKERYLKPLVIAGIFVVPVFEFIFHFTNEAHHLFYASTRLVDNGFFPVMYLEKGPLYYIQALFFGACMVIAAIFILNKYKNSSKKEYSSNILAVIASFLPCIGLLLIAVDAGSLGLDYGAVFFPASCLLLLISILKYQFLNLKPLAMSKVYESTNNGIIVLDENNIIDFNPAAADIFEELDKHAISQSFYAVLGMYEPLLDAVTEKKEEQIEIRKNGVSRYYYATVSDIIIDGQYAGGSIITLTDFTKNVEMVKELEKSEQKNRLLITQMKQGLLVCELLPDEDGEPGNFICIDVNPYFEALTGLKRKDILGRPLFQIYKDKVDAWRDRFVQVTITGRPYQTEYYFEDRDKHFEVVLYSPQPRQFAMILSDITERKEVYNLLKKQRMILGAIARASGEMLTNRGLMSALAEGIRQVGFAAGVDRVSLYENRYEPGKLQFAACHKIEWDAKIGEVNMNPAAFREFSLEQADDFTRALAAGKPFSNTIKNLSKSHARTMLEEANVKSYLILPLYCEKNFWGFLAFYDCNITRLWPDSEIGVLQLFADAVVGAVERNTFEKRIEVLSYHDQLTGLYNRRFFEEEILRLDTKRNFPVTVVIADVNGLKLTNDAFGHFLGDKLLQKAADVFKKECRADDIIARTGGDEFAILLPKTDSREAMRIVQRIQNAITQDTSENMILSISFGFSTKYETEEDMVEVIKKAEDHMYNNKLSESMKIRSKTLEIIKKKLYGKNEREQRHSDRVSQLCRDIGIAMQMNQTQLEELETAGLLHDIGKIAIEERILNKESKLDHTEMAKMRRHAEIGYHILSSVSELAQVAHYVLAHQERWDGTGYPKQLKGDGIPIQSRIIAIADAYDAMTSVSPFRDAINPEDAVMEILNYAGLQFDPDIVRIFVEKVLNYPVVNQKSV